LLQAVTGSDAFLAGDVVAIVDSDDDAVDDDKTSKSSPQKSTASHGSSLASGHAHSGQKGPEKSKDADKADKRLKKLTGPNFVSHRNATYSKADAAVKLMKQKMTAALQSTTEAISLAVGQIGEDKALQAYDDAARRSKHWCELWLGVEQQVIQTIVKHEPLPEPTSAGPVNGQAASPGADEEEPVTAIVTPDPSQAAATPAEAIGAVDGAIATSVAAHLRPDLFAITELRKSIAACSPAHMPVVTAALLRTLTEFTACVGEIMEIESISSLDKHESTFKSFMTCCGEFLKFSTKAAADVKSYLIQREKSAKKQAEKAHVDLEKQMCIQSKARAKAAAVKIQELSQKAPKLFTVSDTCFTTFEVLTLDVARDMTSAQLELPFVVRSCESVTAWLNAPRVSMMLAEYGASYKKSPSFKETSKSMTPIMAGSGKEETDELFGKIVQQKFVADISSVTGGATFASGLWTFGYAPDLHSVTC
jgi:hypothetical protein